MDKDAKIIRDAVAREGRIEGDHVVVPNDFFDRLNAVLNPPRQGPSIIEQLIQAADKKSE